VLVTPDRCGCDKERQYLATQARKIEQQAREQDWRDRLERAGLTGWLANATFDKYQPRADWADTMHAKGRVQGYAYALTNGGLDRPFLILHGGYGTGKSHLAAAVVYAVLEAGWSHVFFRVWPEYLDRIKASWDRDGGETEEDIARELQTGRLVVIDDLDKQPPTDWAKKVLYTAINHRYNAGLATILTFNYGPEDIDPNANRLALVEYLGEAVLDRIIGSAFDVIEFSGPSYRSKVTWKKAA